jgi:hypothetical protein
VLSHCHPVVEELRVVAHIAVSIAAIIMVIVATVALGVILLGPHHVA